MIFQIVDVAPSDLAAHEGPTARSETPADPNMKQDAELGQDTLMTRRDAFGNEEFAEVKYKVLKWWFVADLVFLFGSIYGRQGGLLMVAATISLGILSLPVAIAASGMAPGLTILIMMSLLTSYNGCDWEANITIPVYRQHADASVVLMGRFGRELLGSSQLLLLIFLCATHVLTFSMAFNVITEHGTCSIVFRIVLMVISVDLSLPQTAGLQPSQKHLYPSTFLLLTGVL